MPCIATAFVYSFRSCSAICCFWPWQYRALHHTVSAQSRHRESQVGSAFQPLGGRCVEGESRKAGRAGPPPRTVQGRNLGAGGSSQGGELSSAAGHAATDAGTQSSGGRPACKGRPRGSEPPAGDSQRQEMSRTCCGTRGTQRPSASGTHLMGVSGLGFSHIVFLVVLCQK